MSANMNKEEGTKETNFYHGSRWRLFYSAFAVNLSAMSVGIVFCWSATAIPDIKKNDLTFPHMESMEIGWITSSAMLGAAMVCPIAGYAMQRFGPRRSMLLLAVPLLLGWMLMALAKGFWMLLLGRFITGFCSSGMAVAIPVFSAETADVEVRGLLGCAFKIMCTVGALYSYTLGACVSWRWQSAACGILPLLSCFFMLFVPESPVELISKGKHEEAKKSLAWFRSAPSINLVEEEYYSMLQDQAALKLCKFSWRDFFTTRILRPTGMCLALFLIVASSGIGPVLNFTVNIFEATHVTNGLLACVLVGVTQVIFACGTAMFVDRLGRRPLLISSALGMAFCACAMGCYLRWGHLLDQKWSVLPIPILLLYVIAYAIGLQPIPWFIIGEVVPPGAKGYTSAIAIAFYRGLTFVILLFYDKMVESIGQDTCFGLSSLFCILGAIYIYFRVPETKQKTLTEIQKNFEN